MCHKTHTREKNPDNNDSAVILYLNYGNVARGLSMGEYGTEATKHRDGDIYK